jgi:cytochrome c oxidase subunit 4
MNADSHAPAVGTLTYLVITGLLLILTALTVLAARLDLGPWNPVVAVGIAGLKAGLITLYFMHARWSSGLTWIVIAGGVVWLGLLLAGTLDDLVTRDWLPAPGK